MINVTPIVEFNQIDNLIDFVQVYPELATAAIQDRWNARIKPGFLDELRYIPGPSKNGLNSGTPFIWSLNPAANARARRWFFANYPNGYQRTGALTEAWQVDVGVSDDAAFMSARNNSDAYKWTQGKRQIPGHANTGWIKAQLIIDFWANAAMEEVTAALDELVNQRR